MRRRSTFEKRTLLRSLLIVATASLALTGCGASRAAKPSGVTLAAMIHADGGFWSSARVSCVGRSTCTITWKDRVWWDRSDWLGVMPEVVGVDQDDRYTSVRHFTVRVVDPRSR